MKKRNFLIFAVFFLGLCGQLIRTADAQVQPPSPWSTGPNTPPTTSTGSASSFPGSAASLPPMFVSTAISFGNPLPPDRGPWVLGDIRFIGSQAISEYALQSKVRARRGNLYMPEDISGDVRSLLETGSFDRVTSGIFAIPDQPVPPNYTSIAVSSSMARLVFFLVDKGQGGPGGTTAATPKKALPPPPAPVSGVVLTPTAYRGFGKYNEPGLGLELNGVYYIGRLYGKNSFDYTTERTNYLDRIGQLLMSADGKIQLQSETWLRPAFAAGAQGYFTFRDAPQPAIATGPGVSVHPSDKSTKTLADAYVVFSKKFYGLRSSVGMMEGNIGDFVSGLSEFLSSQALPFEGHLNQTAQSKNVFFANLLLLPRKEYPLAVEFMKPNGMALSPWLLNFKIGYFLHLNFDISYLHFNGGYDLLGTFQFRTTYFPRQ